jgi:hypothetical protein
VSAGVRLRGVGKGKILAVDSTTLEANAAMKSIHDGGLRTDARRAGLVEEPTDRAEQLSDSALPSTEIVGQLGQDLVDPADVFVSVPEAVV